MTDRELMQQALEALEVATTPLAKDRQEVLRAQAALRERLAQPEQEPVAWKPTEADYKEWSDRHDLHGPTDRAAFDDATSLYLTALRERLAQPEQDVPATRFGNMEPVGWFESPDGEFRANPLYKIKFPSSLLSWQVPLYTTPPQRKPEQEPVGRLESDPYEGHVFVPRIDGDWSMLGEDLYTTPPPQRKPLTDEQWQGIADILGGFITREQKDAIETKIKGGA